MVYNTTMILLFRPFISGTLCAQLSETVDPMALCIKSATTMTGLFRRYRSIYTLTNIVNIAVHALFTAATVHLCSLQLEVTSDNSFASSAQQLGRGKDWNNLSESLTMLQEIAQAWPSAYRCVRVINRLLQKYSPISTVTGNGLAGIEPLAGPMDTTAFGETNIGSYFANPSNDLNLLDADWLGTFQFLSATDHSPEIDYSLSFTTT